MEPQATYTLGEFLVLFATVLLGVGSKIGWDRWIGNGRRNGISKDADRIVKAIEQHTKDEDLSNEKIVTAVHKEGEKTRLALHAMSDRIADYRVEVAKHCGGS